MSFVVVRKLRDEDLVQPWRQDKTIEKDVPTFTLKGSTPTLKLADPAATANLRVVAAVAEINQPLVVSKDLGYVGVKGATPAVRLEYPAAQTITIRLPTANRLEIYDEGAAASLGYIAKFKVGQRIPIATIRQYSEKSFTANAVIDAQHVPLSSGIPEDVKLRIFLKVDVYNNAGATTTVRAYFSDGTAAVTTTSTTYVTLSTIVDVPTPAVDSDFVVDIVVTGGTAFVKNLTAMLLYEYK